MKDKLDHFLSLNYRYELFRDEEDGGFFATHPELSGCAAQGETAEEAIVNLDVARRLWIETRVKDGLPIPEPVSEEPSGRFLVRMPSWLHADLTREAQRQGVSLNSLLVSVLSEHIGGSDCRWKLERLVEEVRSKTDEMRSIADQIRVTVKQVGGVASYKASE